MSRCSPGMTVARMLLHGVLHFDVSARRHRITGIKLSEYGCRGPLSPVKVLFPAALAAAMLLAGGGTITAQSISPPVDDSLHTPALQIRIFFISDAHSRRGRVDRFVREANHHRPDLILEGGDMVHDGTEAEFRRALADRGRLDPSWRSVRGNHDAERRGPFSGPPPAMPPFAAFDDRDVRFILLDNHDEKLTEEQFRWLEAELDAHSGRRIVVVMHVPVILTRSPVTLRLRRLVPFRLASPVMRDPGQVERFTTLMERHGVLAVLTGHTHFPDSAVRGGVHYIVAGALGGLTPGLGIANEYVDLTVTGRDISYRRVAMNRPDRDPVSFLSTAFRFYADLNGFNHARQGWNYTPSASVQYKFALRRTETRAGTHTALSGAASFERLLDAPGRHSFFADAGISVGEREQASHIATGYKLRPLGSFNRNVFVGGAAAANLGMLEGSFSAGVGGQLGIGFEWRNVTAEVTRSWATNHQATWFGIGYRY